MLNTNYIISETSYHNVRWPITMSTRMSHKVMMANHANRSLLNISRIIPLDQF